MLKRFYVEDVEELLEEVECSPYQLRVIHIGANSFAIQATLERVDIDTGEKSLGTGGKYYVSPFSTREEIIQKCLAACLAYAEHEVREHFKWKGRRIFGPHMSHDRLWEIAEETVARAPHMPVAEQESKLEGDC